MKENLISFHDIYEKYSMDVYRFTYWLCKNTQDAEDITSETFLRTWTSKSNLEYVTLKAFLFKIARNLFLQKVRNKKVFVDIEYEELKESDTSGQHLELNRVMKQINAFIEPDRSLFIMKTCEGLSYEEISNILEISISSCKVRVHRLRQKLISKAQNKEFS